MKPYSKFKIILCKGTTLITTLLLIAISLTTIAQTPYDESKKREEQKNEHLNDLREFRAKYAVEIARLPHVTLKEVSNQLFYDARKLGIEGREAFTKNSLEEAETKLFASLCLREDEFVRRDYALTLVEEKKYLEALPSCIDAALVNHMVIDESQSSRVHEYPLPLPTLAYTLAQLGNVKMAAIVYNFTRMKLEKDIKRSISMFPSTKKADSMTIGEKLRLPLPPLSVDLEKVNQKSLIEDIRIIFLIITELNYDKSYQQFKPNNLIMPNRLAFQMIEEAYVANPNSPELTFYKGYSEISKEMPSQEAKVESIKKAQEWFRSAATKAGINSPLGKLSAEYIADSEKLRIILEKLIQERKDNP